MAKNSKFMGRTILLTVISILIVTVATGQEWWALDHSTRVSDSPWSNVISIRLYDNNFLHYSTWDSSVEYRIYPSGSPPDGLFDLEETLWIIWILAGLLFICSLLWDMRLLGILIGSGVLIIGALALVIFMLGIGSAVHDSLLSDLADTKSSGFFGAQQYDLTRGDGTTEIHQVIYGPSLGFWLALIALSVQIVAFAIRTYVVRESMMITDTYRKMNMGSDNAPGKA